MFGHLWSSCTTSLSLLWPLLRPRKPVEYCGSFRLGNRQALRKMYTKALLLFFWHFLQTKIRQRLITLHLPSTVCQWQIASAGKKKFNHAHYGSLYLWTKARIPWFFCFRTEQMAGLFWKHLIWIEYIKIQNNIAKLHKLFFYYLLICVILRKIISVNVNVLLQLLIVQQK